MPMERCPNHPDRWGNLKLVVDGKVIWVCMTCYFEAKGEDEEEEE